MPGPNIPKILMAGGAVGFGYYLVMRQYWFPNPYKTQGAQNVEDRFTAGGGAGTHTPGIATKLGGGDSNDTTSRQEGGSKGVGTQTHRENIGDQKTATSDTWPEKFYQPQYNDPKGK